MTDHGLYAAEGFVLTTALGAFAIWAVARLLRRSRPDLNFQRQLIMAFAVRVMAAAALALTSFNGTIRGGDEPGFIAEAHILPRLPFLSGPWLHTLTGHLSLLNKTLTENGSLHVFLMALQVKFFDASVLAMRTTMAAISVVGIALIATAVYELAGARAAKLTAWVLAIEPANIFFSTALHKEPTLYLAEGMIALGGALVWRRARVGPLVLMVVGCLVATASRPYAGWFLAAGSALVLLHGAARAASSRAGWAIGLATIVVGIGVVSTPAIVQKTTRSALGEIQTAQTANTTDTQSHLALEPINFTSRTAIAVNLPRRMFDLMFRPYPWQLGDISQQLGVVETLFVLALLALFARAIARRTQSILSVAGPLVYPAFVILVAYALAVGNAGTGFRYRTQIIPLMIAILFVVRAHARQRVTGDVKTGQPGLLIAEART